MSVDTQIVQDERAALDRVAGEHSGKSTMRSEEDFVVDAVLVAAKLGLSPAEFWREMQRGIVYGVVERGEGDDAGRTRLTFRYRSRSWTVMLEEVMS